MTIKEKIYWAKVNTKATELSKHVYMVKSLSFSMTWKRSK